MPPCFQKIMARKKRPTSEKAAAATGDEATKQGIAASETAQARPPNLDEAEVTRFSQLASEWWDPQGKFKPLHKFNPVRVEYIRDTLLKHFNREIEAARPFSDIDILDIGC